MKQRSCLTVAEADEAGSVHSSICVGKQGLFNIKSSVPGRWTTAGVGHGVVPKTCKQLGQCSAASLHSKSMKLIQGGKKTKRYESSHHLKKLDG